MTHSAYKAELRRQLVAAAAREQARRAPRVPAPRVRTLVAVSLAVAAAVLVALALRAVDQGGNTNDHNVTKPRTEKARPLFGGSIDGGVRYRTRDLVVPISFVPSDDGWFTVGVDRHGIGFYRNPGGPGRSGRNPPRQWMSIGVPPRVVDPATRRVTAPPADVAGWVEHHPDLRVTRRATTSVGGRPAQVLDTTVAFSKPVKHDVDCERRYTSPFQPLEGPITPCTLLAPDFGVPRGMRMRWIVVPGHPTLTIIADAFPAREYRKLLPKVRALVASIRFER